MTGDATPHPAAPPPDPEAVERRAAEFRATYARVRAEVAKVMVGQDGVVDNVLAAIIVGGHVLLEGVPGLGKTMLVRTLSDALDIRFSRIQFTPDLMPADILGTNLVVDTPGGGKEFRFEPGPIFANIVLADEINRATPKTQSALLEAMQEQSVTTGGAVRRLDPPFFVMATQNPIEMEGTYPLPEAQLDRFFFKVDVPFPGLEELERIVERTTGAESPRAEKAVDRDTLLSMRDFVRHVPVAPEVRNYAMRLVLATHPASPHATDLVRKYVRYGSSPRGAQTLMLAARAAGMLDGRYHAGFSDVRRMAVPGLRHRIILNFEGEAEGVRPDAVLADVLEKTPTTAD